MTCYNSNLPSKAPAGLAATHEPGDFATDAACGALRPQRSSAPGGVWPVAAPYTSVMRSHNLKSQKAIT